MGNVQRVLLQAGTTLAMVLLGIWLYRNPRKTLLMYGDWANQALPQKAVTVLGSLCMFLGTYAFVVICVGQYLPDTLAGLLAAATSILIVWGVKRTTRTQG